MAITPMRVEWQGPEGTRVVVELDEDGVSVRWSGRPGGMEEGDLDRLLEVIAEAKKCKADRCVPAPEVPPRGSWQNATARYVARRAVQVATEALRAEFGPDEEVPF